MAFNPNIHHRRSIRLRDYDYSSGGAYFITICTHQRECLFGEVVDGTMKLNEAGMAAQEFCEALSERYPGVEVDSFVVMPNHVHGIIIVLDPVGAIHESPRHPSPRRGMILSKLVGYLKMNTGKRINEIRNTPGVTVWQRNYYEHVIRHADELSTIQRYIVENPVKWEEDENNPLKLR